MTKKRKEVVKSVTQDDLGTTWIEKDGTSNRFLVFYGNVLTLIGTTLIKWGEPYATYYEMEIDLEGQYDEND